MKERLQRTLVKYAIILAIGAVYSAFVLIVGRGIPCFFYELTGLECPSCGVSRMLLSLLKLDFRAAFSYNPFLFVNGPIIIFCIAYGDWRYVKYGSRRMGKVAVVLWTEVVLAVLFGIFRNIF